MSSLEERFIDRLKQLAEGGERGALASLRRGLGQPPGTVAEMYRYVEPFLGGMESGARYKESAFYLVAALFAFHPKSTNEGNMGTHLARTRTDAGADALERRFTALLAAHPDDLPEYLRQAVSFLKSKDEEPVNWNQLLRDLQNWSHEDRFVQKNWARSFWGRRPSSESTNNSNEKGE
ncbi:MAG TPA: type I-E CRISPR-associated protein Cse2/CasB [Anaerolineales bacterium]|nr:type I-E CRISPR-associated protein Cse2/CasB [Anaerolineales bacterium]